MRASPGTASRQQVQSQVPDRKKYKSEKGVTALSNRDHKSGTATSKYDMLQVSNWKACNAVGGKVVKNMESCKSFS